MEDKAKHIKVSTVQEAWKKAAEIIGGDYTKDATGSEGAGYPIYRSRTEYYDYICDLNCRLEVNLHDGSTTNIWIQDVEDLDKKYTIDEFRKMVCDERRELARCRAIMDFLKEDPLKTADNGKVIEYVVRLAEARRRRLYELTGEWM